MREREKRRDVHPPNKQRTLTSSPSPHQDLRALSFRQNLLTDASPLAGLASAPILADLVLHDNQLATLPDLAPLTALTRLELSYNQLSSLRPLASLGGAAAGMRELYAAANAVTGLEGLEGLAARLEVLELGSNALTGLEGLAGGAPALTALWLGRNRIPAIGRGLAGLSSLRVLALPSNRLTTMADLGAGDTPALEELYLSHNGITALAGLAALPRLRVLDVAANRVADVRDLAAAAPLTDLWLNDNALAGLGELAGALRGGKAGATITCAYLAGNPGVEALKAAGRAAASGGGDGRDGPGGSGPPAAAGQPRAQTGLVLGYVRAVVAMMPALEELDGDEVGPVLRRAGGGGG